MKKYGFMEVFGNFIFTMARCAPEMLDAARKQRFMTNAFSLAVVFYIFAIVYSTRQIFLLKI